MTPDRELIHRVEHEIGRVVDVQVVAHRVEGDEDRGRLGRELGPSDMRDDALQFTELLSGTVQVGDAADQAWKRRIVRANPRTISSPASLDRPYAESGTGSLASVNGGNRDLPYTPPADEA